MALRNFWIEADIDGREHALKGGPVGNDGTFTLTIYVADDGVSVPAVRIEGRANPVTGDLTIVARKEVAFRGTVPAGDPLLTVWANRNKETGDAA